MITTAIRAGVDGAALSDLFCRVAPFTGNPYGKRRTDCVCLDLSPGVLRATATDTYRLATGTIPASYDGPALRLLVPPGPIEAGDIVIEPPYGSGTIHPLKNEPCAAIVTLPGRELQVTELGTFPRWQTVLPGTAPDWVLSFDTQDLYNALSLDGLPVVEGFPRVAIRCSGSEVGMDIINQRDPLPDPVDLPLTVEHGQDRPLEVVFNARWLCAGVRCVDSDRGTLELRVSAGSYNVPAVIPDGDWRYVLMPARI